MIIYIWSKLLSDRIKIQIKRFMVKMFLSKKWFKHWIKEMYIYDDVIFKKCTFN